jgi:hypothetical protein
MKLNLLALVGLMAGMESVHSKTPVLPTPVNAEESSGVAWEIAAGYDTAYIFRGEYLMDHTPWAQLSIDLPFSETLSLNITPWYLFRADGLEYREFDLNTTLTYTHGETSFDFGYAGYFYPEGGSGDGEGVGDEQEVSLAVTREIFGLEATLFGVYSISRDGFYYEASLTKSFEINDTFALEVSGALGFNTDYYGPGTDLGHAMITVTLPIQLRENLVLSPYIAGNMPMGHLQDGEDKLFGGVRLAFSF